jgi:glycosyltransferase involved in cell wall biosynthesis
MDISILLPVCNTPPQFLVESIRSCFQQSLSPAELVIIDDGSTAAATLACLAEIRNVRGVRLEVLGENRGISAALNAGLAIAKCDWVARMDADDIMLPHRLAAQADFIQRRGEPDVVGGQIVYFGAESGAFTMHPEVITADLARAHANGWFLNHPSVVYRRRSVLDAGGYDSRFNGCEDMELWYRMLARGMRLANIPSIVLMYRIHAGQATRRNRVVPLDEFKGYLTPRAPPATPG